MKLSSSECMPLSIRLESLQTACEEFLQQITQFYTGTASKSQRRRVQALQPTLQPSAVQVALHNSNRVSKKMMKTFLLQMVKTSRARVIVRIESFNCSSSFIAQLPTITCEHLSGIEERLQDMTRLSNTKRQWSFPNKCSNNVTVPIDF